MTRGRRKWSEDTVARLHAQGRGQGEAALYKPWLTVADLSSSGNSRRVFSPKTGREHHLLSNIEYDLFLLLEWSPEVVDIREQFPLDRALTQELAALLEIRHPFYPGTHVPTVMTVDFMVTRIRHGRRTLEAVNAKPASQAQDLRALEKLEIQRGYFEGMQIPHHLVFDTLLPATKVRNIEWIRDSAPRTNEQERYPGFLGELMARMADEFRAGLTDQPLDRYCVDFDARAGLEPGVALRVARMLMHARVLIADLARPQLHAAPTSSFSATSAPSALHAAGEP